MLSRPTWPLKRQVLVVPRLYYNQNRTMSSQPAKRQRSASAAASSLSVDISEFDDIVEEMSSYDQQRETVSSSAEQDRHHRLAAGVIC